MKVFWIKGKRNSREYAEKALMLYKGIRGKLEHDEKGRPYFKDIELNISISHSNNIWVCVIGEKNCGIDIEFVKERDYNSIAERMFTKEEALYVKSNGIESFFRLWTMKEAYLKYAGKSLFEMKNKNFISDEQTEYVFRNLRIADGAECTLCFEKGDGFWKEAIEEMHI